jgi:hypothetical protein
LHAVLDRDAVVYAAFRPLGQVSFEMSCGILIAVDLEEQGQGIKKNLLNIGGDVPLCHPVSATVSRPLSGNTGTYTELLRSVANSIKQKSKLNDNHGMLTLATVPSSGFEFNPSFCFISLPYFAFVKSYSSSPKNEN